MPRLVWDNIGERLYETGIDRGVLYPQDATGNYPQGVVWNGLSSVSESPSGAEANAIYADNIKYLELRSAEEFGATVEAYTYPDEFAVCDGSAEVATGVNIGQQPRKRFGLSYRTIVGNDVENDAYGYKLHLIYNAMASPSERQYQTVNDSPEAISFSWEMTTTPVAVGGTYKPTAAMTIDSTKADATKLAALEDILYGTDTADARLPLPSEVIELMGGDATFDIHLNRANVSVQAGRTTTVKATTTPAGKTVTWASSDDTKATVANGVITGVAAGNATITASFTEDGVTYNLIDPDESLRNIGTIEPPIEEFAKYKGNERIPATIYQFNGEWLCTACEKIDAFVGDKLESVAQVGVDIDMNDVVAERYSFIFNSALFIIVLIILTIIASMFMTRRFITKPIKQLSDSATGFAKNDVFAKEDVIKHPVQSNDEIGDLYQDIQSMQMRIIDSADKLERITSERERVKTELRMASDIQNSMLPSEFPPFPENPLY